jgi:hypothetical protein
VTKRVAASLALALCLVGCSWLAPNGDSVQLLTGPPGSSSLGCFTDAATGPLIVDPKYGTAIIDEVMIKVSGTRPPPVPVAWRPGFSARHVGSEVEVFDPQGNAVAITGRSYVLAGGYVSAGGSSGLDWPELPIGVFWACGFVAPQP